MLEASYVFQHAEMQDECSSLLSDLDSKTSTNMTSPLYCTCRSISFDAIQVSLGFRHHQSARLFRLEVSREYGCPMCSILWKAVCLEEHLCDDDSLRLSLDSPGSTVESDPCSGTRPILMKDIVIFCGKAKTWIN
jgi:hypothetical protein